METDPLRRREPGDPFALDTHGTGSRAAPRRAKANEGSMMMMGNIVLIIVPWLLFVGISMLYAFLYHHSREIVWLASIACVALAAMFMSMDRMHGNWYPFLGMLSLVAVLSGNICGMYNYSEYMLQYWAYNQNRSYTNVLPSEPAAAHADAGKIEFAGSARIDTTKAVGYKSGDTYCVAPVMDETQTSRVEYWAAGIGCCKQRADFSCDQAADPTAHSGVVILDSNSFFTSSRDFFKLAVKQAEAQYDIVSAPEPLFVRWVAKPEEVQDMFWTYGIGYLLVSVFVYLLVSTVLGFACGVMSKRTAHRSAV